MSEFSGGKVIKPDNPCYIKLANTWIILNSGGGPTPASQTSFLKRRRIRTDQIASLICVSPISGRATNNGATKARPFLPSH